MITWVRNSSRSESSYRFTSGYQCYRLGSRRQAGESSGASTGIPEPVARHSSSTKSCFRSAATFLKRKFREGVCRVSHLRC